MNPPVREMKMPVTEENNPKRHCPTGLKSAHETAVMRQDRLVEEGECGYEKAETEGVYQGRPQPRVS